MSRRRAQGEGTVYFDETRGRWVGQVWLDGRRRKVSAKTKTDASAKLGRLVHGDASERHVDRRLSVKGLLEDWQKVALPPRHLAPKTIEIHEWAADHWIKAIGTKKIAALGATDIEKVLNRLATEEGFSKSSLTKLRSTLRQALRWAERRRMVAHNAAEAAELPVTNHASTKRALAPDELKKLLAALTGHPLGPMFELMARVGLRPGEAAGLCADAVDLDADPPTVSIVRGVQLLRSAPVLVDALKTTGARRTLAIPADLAAILPRRDDDELLFPGPGGGPLWPSTVRAELTKACEAIKLDRIRPNELRHTAATHLAEHLPPHRVADILGHRTTRMIDIVYRHRPDVIRGAEG